MPSFWSPDTEALTEVGFRRILDLTPHNLIAVTDGTRTWFETPATVLRSKLRRLSTRVVRTTQSEQLFGVFQKDSSILMGVGIGYSQYQPTFIKVGSATGKQLSRIYNAFQIDGGVESRLSMMCRFRIATQADGSVSRRGRDGKYAVSFSFSREHKIDRLEAICEHLRSLYGIEYQIDMSDVTRFYILCPFECYKRFSEWLNLANKGKQWMTSFIEEVKKWDSHIIDDGSFSYSTNNAGDLNAVQSVAVLCGYKTRVSFQQKTGVYSMTCNEWSPFNGMGMHFDGESFSFEEWGSPVPATQNAGVILRSNNIVFAGK